MGLIKQVFDAAGGALDTTIQSSMFKEYFVSGDMSASVLMKRAEKVITERGQNKKVDDNLISSGSGIDVQENQFMLIVEDGKVVDFCAEPGRYQYDASSAPSMFCGNNKGLKALAKDFVSNLATGGQRFHTQRVYFINMGRIWEPILWGLGNVGFTHSFQPNPNINPIRRQLMLQCRGSITLRIGNPLAFYKEIGAQMAGGDNSAYISIKSIENTLLSSIKMAVKSAVASAIGQVSRENVVGYAEIMNFEEQITAAINSKMADNSIAKAGFEFFDFFIDGTPELPEKDKAILDNLENEYNLASDPLLASLHVQSAMAEGFKAAGSNPNGGIGSMMGMGLAVGQAGGLGSFGNFQTSPQQQQMAQQNAYNQQQQQMEAERQRLDEERRQFELEKQRAAEEAARNAAPAPVASPANNGETWICECGATNTAKFCVECGAKKPIAPADGTWTCDCGAVNTAKFCPECGAKKPEPKKVLKCDKCGWVAAEGQITKFCPECGDPVNEADFQ